MEEEYEEYRAPPYWLPSSNSFRRTNSSSSFSFSSGTARNSFRRASFVILLLAATVAFIPSLSSSFSFRLQSVNNGWDYLNLLLVLFSIICGFLSRNRSGAGDSSSSYASSLKSNSSTPRSSSFDRIRSSSSDPDLRQESLVSKADDRRIVFDDDRRIVFDDAQICRSRRWTEEEEHEERSRCGYSYFQTIHVDRVEVHSQEVRNELPPPLPPPPPPFKVPDWEFVMRGDYVRIKSANASRSWPDPIDDMEGTQSRGNSPSKSSVASTDASEETSLALFCPSPDVNTKADNFIASFWAALQLEKVNSLRRRAEMNLGPDPILDPGPAL